MPVAELLGTDVDPPGTKSDLVCEYNVLLNTSVELPNIAAVEGIVFDINAVSDGISVGNGSNVNDGITRSVVPDGQITISSSVHGSVGCGHPTVGAVVDISSDAAESTHVMCPGGGG